MELAEAVVEGTARAGYRQFRIVSAPRPGGGRLRRDSLRIEPTEEALRWIDEANGGRGLLLSPGPETGLLEVSGSASQAAALPRERGGPLRPAETDGTRGTSLRPSPGREALGLLETTWWRINEPIGHLVRDLLAEGSAVGGLPGPCEYAPAEVGEARGRSARLAWEREAERVRRRNRLPTL